MDSKQARAAFVEFFEKEGHRFWRSSPVVPYNDPTLLFVNAGMCQYKAIFLGDADAGTEFGQLRRACNSQKCIRAGGKHNDLEDVGKDCYHHTFFEMLGNWSFGDYFKETAIELAWRCLTQVYKLDPERLYATYFAGDTAAGLEPDLEAKEYWLKYLPESRVLPGNMKENFWEMGETGPCGPCSELHYDRIGGRQVPERVNQDDPNVIEIWNLVFMQYNRESSGKLSPLPHPCVDTGMGLERLVSILNDVPSNYDTDFFTGLFKRILELAPDAPRAYEGKVGDEDPKHIDLAYRAIADHIRTLSIAIADGAVPSNEGRGYVLRRILRRAVRYGRQVLNAPKDNCWFSQLTDTVINNLGDAYPELVTHREKIISIISEEELQFGRTLDRGTALFKKAIKTMKAGDVLNGAICFELFATYGFPIDLTEVMCQEQGLKIDLDGFQAAMDKHHLVSDGGNAKKLIQHLTPEQIHHLKVVSEVEPTDDSSKYTWDADHGKGEPMEATVKAIFNGQDFVKSVQSGHVDGRSKVAALTADSDDPIYVILDKTNFYAESGGQVGDTGYATAENADLIIKDTRKIGGYVLHVGNLNNGEINVGDKVSLTCDFARRGKIAKNHTATHVLNCVLRNVLGNETNQAGSIVEPTKLRFDFTAKKALTHQQIEAVESGVAEQIAAELAVDVEEIALAQAKAIEGVRCMFGENYPDPVRVVSVGSKVRDLIQAGNQEGLQHAVEFCGGTHLHNSRAIEKFVVMSEESIAGGIRRMVAITGEAATRVCAESATLLAKVQAVAAVGAQGVTKAQISGLKDEVNSRKDQTSLLVRKDCVDLLDKLTQEKVKLAKELAKQRKEIAAEKAKNAAGIVVDGGYKWCVIVEDTLGGDFKAMEEFTSKFAAQIPNTPLIVASADPETAGAVSVLATVPAAVDSLNAAEWITQSCANMTFKSGGKQATARGTVSDGFSQIAWTRQGFNYASTNFREEA